MAKNQLAKDAFQEYKVKTNSKIDQYTRLKTFFPFNNFPRQAAGTWRSMMLTVIWGTIVTNLSGNTIDYLKKWRLGK